MQSPSRRAFLVGRRTERSPWETFLARLRPAAPPFEMHSIPRDRVEALIAASGGRLVRATAWSDAGMRLDESAARRIAERDAATGEAEYAELETLVRTHLPRCD